MLKFAGNLRTLESCVTLSKFPPPTKMAELTLTDMILLNGLKRGKNALLQSANLQSGAPFPSETIRATKSPFYLNTI